MAESRINGVTRKVNYQGTDCYQPGVRVIASYGTTTYWARGVLLTRRAHARETADRLATESREAGRIVL